MKCILRQITLIFLGGMLLGLGVNALRGSESGRLPWITRWSLSLEAQAEEAGLKMVGLREVEAAAQDGSWVLVDARPDEDYAEGRIPSAFSLPAHDVAERFLDLQPLLFPGQLILCYCNGVNCDDSLIVGRFLVEQGYTNVFLFEGGIDAWRAAENPVEGAP